MFPQNYILIYEVCLSPKFNVSSNFLLSTVGLDKRLNLQVFYGRTECSVFFLLRRTTSLTVRTYPVTDRYLRQIISTYTYSHASQVEVVPKLFKKIVKVPFMMCRYWNTVWDFVYDVQLLPVRNVIKIYRNDTDCTQGPVDIRAYLTDRLDRHQPHYHPPLK